jgi:hypothetical protein
LGLRSVEEVTVRGALYTPTSAGRTGYSRCGRVIRVIWIQEAQRLWSGIPFSLFPSWQAQVFFVLLLLKAEDWDFDLLKRLQSGALYTPTSALLTGCADTVADFRLFTGSKIPVRGESSVSFGYRRRRGFGVEFPSGCFLLGRLEFFCFAFIEGRGLGLLSERRPQSGGLCTLQPPPCVLDIPVAGESSVSFGYRRRRGFGGDFSSGCFLLGRL